MDPEPYSPPTHGKIVITWERDPTGNYEIKLRPDEGLPPELLREIMTLARRMAD